MIIVCLFLIHVHAADYGKIANFSYNSDLFVMRSEVKRIEENLRADAVHFSLTGKWFFFCLINNIGLIYALCRFRGSTPRLKSHFGLLLFIAQF